jgi:hypothetical protein
LARELFHALPHDFTRLELHRRTRRNYETAPRLIRVSSDPRSGKAREEHAEVSQLNRNIVGQAFGDFIEGLLHHIEDLVLNHPGLIADRHHNVALG